MGEMDPKKWEKKKKRNMARLPLLIKVHPKKYPTPLHKRLAKAEAQYEQMEKDYKVRYEAWFHDPNPNKGPAPKKRVLRMARLEKLAASLMRRLGANLDVIPPDMLEKEVERKVPSKIVRPEDVSVIKSPSEGGSIERVGDLDVIRGIEGEKIK